jgi:hypothetical protein
LLAAPVRGRADRQYRPARGQQRIGGAAVLGSEPQPRRRRRVEPEQPAQLSHPVLAGIAPPGDPARAGAQQPGQCRAAQIDDDVPAGRRDRGVKRQPVPRPAALVDDDQPLQSRHRSEQRRGERPGRDRQPRRGIALDQVRQDAGRQHGVADPRRGDEQDAHAAPIAAPPLLAKLPPSLYLLR